MFAVTAAEMKAIESRAAEVYGFPYRVMMENAGRRVAETTAQVSGDPSGKRIVIFAGRGNNGGDGFVAGRHLMNQGARVCVILVAGDPTGVDAILYLEILERMGAEIVPVLTERDWDRVHMELHLADVLIDAMVGTGFQGELSGTVRTGCELLNRAGKPVIAVDIPSGVRADTGEIAGGAVQATRTVTFGTVKLGHLLYPGRSYAGEVIVDDIGIPAAVLAETGIRHTVLERTAVRKWIGTRAPDAHKGTAGSVLVIGGSRGMIGAPAMVAEGALRSGGGRVTVAVPASQQPIVAGMVREMMTIAAPEGQAGCLGLAALEELLVQARRMQVVAIGPGLGRQPETMELVRELVRRLEIPIILDADGLYAFSGQTQLLQEAGSLLVLTPHPGEMGVLTGLPAELINRQRTTIAGQYAQEWGHVVVLKGAPTIVALPDGEGAINSTGNAGMATAGMGDVLTGIIAGLIAQGLPCQFAAQAGVYLHGLAGDLAAAGGQRGLMARDVLHRIPATMQCVD